MGPCGQASKLTQKAETGHSSGRSNPGPLTDMTSTATPGHRSHCDLTGSSLGQVWLYYNANGRIRALVREFAAWRLSDMQHSSSFTACAPTFDRQVNLWRRLTPRDGQAIVRRAGGPNGRLSNWWQGRDGWKGALCWPQGSIGMLEGLLLQAHHCCQVGLEPDCISDELSQLLVHQGLLLLEGLARPCIARQEAPRNEDRLTGILERVNGSRRMTQACTDILEPTPTCLSECVRNAQIANHSEISWPHMSYHQLTPLYCPKIRMRNL